MRCWWENICSKRGANVVESVLVEVLDLEILTEGYCMINTVYMAKDSIGLRGITREDAGKSITEPGASNDFFSDDGIKPPDNFV